MTSLAKRLIQSANEAQAIARGEADPATYRVHVPSDLDVTVIRRSLRMTQAAFASSFGLPAGSIRDWEQGLVRPARPRGSRSAPERSSAALLPVASRKPNSWRSGER